MGVEEAGDLREMDPVDKRFFRSEL